MTEPQITVSNVRLSSHRCLPGAVAAWADLTITGKSGIPRRWENVRLVFDGFFPVDLPVGSYRLLVQGEYRRSHTRGKKLVPARWKRAACDGVYNAAVAEEERIKKEVADGTRWKPLPLSAIRGVQAGGIHAW